MSQSMTAFWWIWFSCECQSPQSPLP